MRTHYIKRVPHIYYWVKYKVGDKYGQLGPYDTEEQANEDATNELRGAASYEIFPLDTKNKSAASSKLKKITLRETKDIGLAMQRMHRVPPSAPSQHFVHPSRPPENNEQKPFLLM